MKININLIESEEKLERFGNRFFTKEQVKEIMGA